MTEKPQFGRVLSVVRPGQVREGMDPKLNTKGTEPLTWFAELWLALQVGDHDRAIRARQMLRRLGFDVLIDFERDGKAAALPAGLTEGDLQRGYAQAVRP